jgi:hypothetical protein
MPEEKNHTDQMEKPNGIPKKYEEENYVDVSKNVWNYSLLTDEVSVITSRALITVSTKNSVHILYR